MDVPFAPLETLEPSELVFLLDTLGSVFLVLSGLRVLFSAAKTGPPTNSAMAAVAAKRDFIGFPPTMLLKGQPAQRRSVPGENHPITYDLNVVTRRVPHIIHYNQSTLR